MFHCGENFFAVKPVPRGGNHGCVCVVFTHKIYRVCKFFRVGYVGVAEHYAGGGFYLVVEKFAEVFHIHSALRRIHHGGEGVDFAVL